MGNSEVDRHPCVEVEFQFMICVRLVLSINVVVVVVFVGVVVVGTDIKHATRVRYCSVFLL